MEANETYSGELVFETAAAMKKAVATPKDRTIDGQELECELARREERIPRFKHSRCCLHTSGIEHILSREPDGWFTERKWEDTLSGGEQQRLCFARVLYHGPTFALLDECTSMVAADAEEDLYRRLFHDWGITPITMTQRMFMPDLYVQEVSLGTPSLEGWELFDGKSPKRH